MIKKTLIVIFLTIFTFNAFSKTDNDQQDIEKLAAQLAALKKTPGLSNCKTYTQIEQMCATAGNYENCLRVKLGGEYQIYIYNKSNCSNIQFLEGAIDMARTARKNPQYEANIEAKRRETERKAAKRQAEIQNGEWEYYSPGYIRNPGTGEIVAK